MIYNIQSEKGRIVMNIYRYKQLFTDTRYDQYYKKMLTLFLHHVGCLEEKLDNIDKLCDSIKNNCAKELSKDKCTKEEKDEIIKRLGLACDISDLLEEIIDKNDTLMTNFEIWSQNFDLFIKHFPEVLSKYRENNKHDKNDIEDALLEQKEYTLHEAMIKILKENNNQMKVKDLADELNLRGLYKKKDLSKINYHQIYARAARHDELFGFHKGTISLKSATSDFDF